MADVGAILRAAPIGLLMLVGSYIAAKRRQSGAVRASKEFPELAARLGLTLGPAEPGRVGTLSGEYEGTHRVFVESHDRPRVVVYFTSAPLVVLRTFEHEKRTPKDMEPFSSGDAAFDRFFKERFASAPLARAIREKSGALGALIEPFTARWHRNVLHVSITSERLECALDFGRPSHIPREAVENLLAGGAALVRFIESLKQVLVLVGGETGA